MVLVGSTFPSFGPAAIFAGQAISQRGTKEDCEANDAPMHQA